MEEEKGDKYFDIDLFRCPNDCDGTKWRCNVFSVMIELMDTKFAELMFNSSIKNLCDNNKAMDDVEFKEYLEQISELFFESYTRMVRIDYDVFWGDIKDGIDSLKEETDNEKIKLFKDYLEKIYSVKEYEWKEGLRLISKVYFYEPLVGLLEIEKGVEVNINEYIKALNQMCNRFNEEVLGTYYPHVQIWADMRKNIHIFTCLSRQHKWKTLFKLPYAEKMGDLLSEYEIYLSHIDKIIGDIISCSK